MQTPDLLARPHHYFFDESADYEKWLGVPSLPTSNHSCPTLREELVDRPDAPQRTGGDDGQAR